MRTHQSEGVGGSRVVRGVVICSQIVDLTEHERPRSPPAKTASVSRPRTWIQGSKDVRHGSVNRGLDPPFGRVEHLDEAFQHLAHVAPDEVDDQHGDARCQLDEEVDSPGGEVVEGEPEAPGRDVVVLRAGRGERRGQMSSGSEATEPTYHETCMRRSWVIAFLVVARIPAQGSSVGRLDCAIARK